MKFAYAIVGFFLPLLVSAEVPFEAQLIDDKVEIGYGVAIGDVDGDGKPDILLADKKEFVWYQNPSWTKHVMLENLTFRDNVCIAAQDIDGDGMVEVAVGAQWNPGNTRDLDESGSVHILNRPPDPTERWSAQQLEHEPTTHRMRWAKLDGKWQLVVLPLHGRDNKNGAGKGVRILAYEPGTWKTSVLDETLHKTHNFDVVDDRIYVAGAEGVKIITPENKLMPFAGSNGGGEVRLFDSGAGDGFAVVEPMHGNELVAYTPKGEGYRRQVLTAELNQGHAIATADFLGLGTDQIAVGWRNPNKQKAYGVKLFVPDAGAASGWIGHWIDQNGMACENMQQADLNGDGKPDLIAAGRVSKNLKIYWNKR